MRFEVRAYTEGRITSVVVDAINQTDALRQVTEQALQPLSANEIGTPVGHWFSREKSFQTLLFSQEILALLQAGLSIIEAVDTLAERERQPGPRSILDQLASRLREGRSFSGALETIPEIFPMLFTGIVRASERTGNLPEALERYIDYRKRLESLRGKVISAAIYPALLISVGIAVTLFLGGYVIPKFAIVYHGTGRALPMASALLLQWGNFANTHLNILLVGLGAFIAALVIGVRHLMARGGLIVLLKHLPVIAEHIRIYELARLYLTLGMLLDSGLPIIQALSLAAESVSPEQQAALSNAATDIRHGERMSTAFERARLTSAVGLRMLRIGEGSGRLGEMMTRAARFHDDETARWIEHFSKVAEPLLMVAIGLVIGTIVVLLYMPIFDLAGSMR